MRYRIWFYGSEAYWFGWRTLLPIKRGHDEFGRWCICLGWSITGKVVIAIKNCNEHGDESCARGQMVLARAKSIANAGHQPSANPTEHADHCRAAIEGER